MRHAFSRLAIAIGLAPTLLLALALPAEAHGGHCGGPRKPPCSILRPPEELSVEAELIPPLGPECIALVGGFDSTEGDDTFDHLFRWTTDEPRYQLYRFGTYEGARYPYDTTGRIDASAEDLTRMVRSLRGRCGAFHIVTHSMGGAVADRAFAKGLSARDGIATYIALSGPHNGATLAKALRPAIEEDPLIAAEISALSHLIDQPDPTTPAAYDLARKEPPHRIVRDVAPLRLHVATDLFVLPRDNTDRRIDHREYLALDEIDGHGGILENDEVQGVVATTVVTHTAAVDNRSARERRLAGIVSGIVDRDAAALYGSISDLLFAPGAPLALAELYGTARLGAIATAAVAEALKVLGP